LLPFARKEKEKAERLGHYKERKRNDKPFISDLRYYLNQYQLLQQGVHLCQHTAAAPGLGVSYS
jgi:hypothetical protein